MIELSTGEFLLTILAAFAVGMIVALILRVFGE